MHKSLATNQFLAYGHNSSTQAVNNSTLNLAFLIVSNMTASKGKMIGRYTEEALLKRAKEVVEEKAKGSDFFDEDAEKDMPRFKRTGEYILCINAFWPFVYYDD